MTLELWSDPENDGEASCCSAQAVRGARELAHSLGMAHFSIDLREEFRAGVVDHWLVDHAAGLTPNPCVRCNGNVRLDAMLELAERLGSQTLATGHYARVEEGPLLRVAVDEAQGSELCALGALARVARPSVLPAGELRKPHVRELAERAGLGVARRRDSQDLCFLAGTRQRSFLERHGGLGERPGSIVDRRGEVLGEHAGVAPVHGGSAPRPGHRRPRAAVRARDRRGAEHGDGRARASSCLHARWSVREVTLHREAGAVDGVRVRAHGRLFACRLAEGLPAGRHARVRVALERAGGAHGAGPARVPVCGRAGRRPRHDLRVAPPGGRPGATRVNLRSCPR